MILTERADYSRSCQEICRAKIHPQYPEKNKVTLATGPLSATAGRTHPAARAHNHFVQRVPVLEENTTRGTIIGGD